jgi:predicted DNA-binding protein
MRVGNRVATPLYLDQSQKKALKQLSERTRVPMQEYLREAVDMVLKKYKAK